MTKEIELWKGEFGDAYIERNKITEDDIEARKLLWNSILSQIVNIGYVPENFLEIGAGQGANLTAIGDIYRGYGRSVVLDAVEPNLYAQRKLDNIPFVRYVHPDITRFSQLKASHDVVFTYGVLIHVHPEDLLDYMKQIYALSKRNIICIEYFSDQPREVTYHGQKALWTRDFGSCWLDNFPGIRCINYIFQWKRMSKLDNVTAWIFEKVN